MTDPAGGPALPISISGGAGGIDARYQDLHTLARLSEDLGGTLGAVAVEGHAVLVDPDLLASAALDPGGAAAVERALLAALDGRDGLTGLATDYLAHAVKIKASVALYQATEEAQRDLFDALCRTMGEHPLLTGMLAADAAPFWLPFAVGDLAADDWDVQRFLSDHLGLVDGLVAAAPGLVEWGSGGALAPSDVTSGAHLIGLLYPDGRAIVAPEDRAQVDGAPGVPNPLERPPATIGDLVDGLHFRNSSVTPDTPDRIDVRVVRHADGTTGYIVDIPGTKVWDVPGQDTGEHLNTLGTNVHLIGGDATAREQAVAEALRQAGASPTDPVMLVGHSQGGIVAAQAAHDAGAGTFGYNVTHVVTAGAPIGRIDVPAGVQVLALENRHDIVPHLDAAGNRDRPNVTTVSFDLQNGDLGSNHDTGKSYAVAAHALDGSRDASVGAWTAGAGAFLDPAATTDYTIYDIRRQP